MSDMSHQRGTNPITRDVNAAQRVTMAVKLRASKMGYEAIARQAGYSNASSARKAVMRELDRILVVNVDELRREELLTLDTLQTECMILALDRNNKRRLFAVDRIIAIMERRAKLLGLDIPVDQTINQNFTVVREVPQGWLAPMEAET